MSSSVSLPCNGLCCPCLEHCMLNHRGLSIMCGTFIYFPCMLLLFITWIVQIPLTFILNIIIYAFCCNCSCSRCANRNISMRKDKELLDYMKDGSVLLTVDPPQLNSSSQIEPQSNEREKQQISLIHWNIFGPFGRYWLRYPLLTKVLKELEPDILCFNEAITVSWWSFGTINTVKKINNAYNGFHISIYNIVHDSVKLLFRYSFCWKAVYELQSCCNIYFMIPYWRAAFWYLSMRTHAVIQVTFALFTGVLCHFGNAILFKDKPLLYQSYITLQPGFRHAMKSLYVVQDKEEKVTKTIWIVSCHLTAKMEAMYQANDPCAKQCQEVLDWAEKDQNEVYKADAIVICGDFNDKPGSKSYKLMESYGYKSVMLEKHGKEKETFPTGTWAAYAPHVSGKQKAKRCLDFVWVKSEDKELSIDEVELIGNDCEDSKHLGNDVKIYASDHLGIYCKFSL